MSAGQKILEGLKQAVAGNFARVLIDGQSWVRQDGWKRVANADAWALGEEQRNGFHVRRIVWGRELARAEKREGEKIKRARLWVEK